MVDEKTINSIKALISAGLSMMEQGQMETGFELFYLAGELLEQNS